MVIADLNYLEVASEANNIEGGWFWYSPNTAYASAGALALGYSTYTSTYTSTFTTPYSSASGSSSYSQSN